MKFFQNLFKSSKNTNKTYRRVSAKSYIVSNCVLGDWNDPSVMLQDKSLIFDVVFSNEDSKAKLSINNKMYYDQIHRFYSLSYEQLATVVDIINVSPENYRSLYDHWPKSIDMETYERLYERLKLDFVSEIPISRETIPAYIISINMNFWSKTGERLLGEMTLSTYEKKYLPEELIHSDYDSATNYAAIVTNRLTRDGEITEYFFSDKIIQELKDARGKSSDISKIDRVIKEIENQKFIFFDFQDYSYSGIDELPYAEVLARVHNEYKRILSLNELQIQSLLEACSLIDNPPFFIYHILSDK